MDYTYKKIKNFATLLSKELGLQMRIHKEGKTLVCFLREWLDLDPYAWVDINIGTYDKWMQDLHMRREIHGGGDWYALSDFSEEKQAMVRDARRKGEPVVWIEMAIRTMRHKRHEARCALIKGSECEFGDDDFNYIKEWLEERRATIAPEEAAALKVINSRGFYYPHYDKQSETISVQKDGKWGFLNKQGKEMSPFVYDEIQMSDFEGGFVRVCKNGKWGYVNDKCEEMCEFVYEFDWRNFLRLGDKLYKPNADGVLEEYEKKPVDDNDLPF